MKKKRLWTLKQQARMSLVAVPVVSIQRKTTRDRDFMESLLEALRNKHYNHSDDSDSPITDLQELHALWGEK